MSELNQIREDTRFERWTVVIGIVLLGFNLRPVAVSVGPVLAEVVQGLAMGELATGVLTALPVIAFAVFGALAPVTAGRVGLHRLTLLCLFAVAGGLLGRSMTSSVPVFLLLTMLALAGMAAANVLLPSLVKLHFPKRIGLLTALYTTSLALGITAASVFTVPLADYTGSWRGGLAFWAVAAAVAALPWVLMLRHDAALRSRQRSISLLQVSRTRLGWAMALLFGLQSAQAYAVFGWFAQIYRDAGFSPSTAGLLLGTITAVGIPLSLWAPAAIARTHNQTRLMLILVAFYPAGYLGLVIAPVAGAWLWATLVGVGMSLFPVVLTLIGLRSHTSDGTAALSGFAQGVGYGLAAAGPFGVGLLYHATGGWTWPLLLLIAMSGATALLAIVVGQPHYVEDQIIPTQRT